MKKITRRASSKEELNNLIFDTERAITLSKKTLENITTKKQERLINALNKANILHKEIIKNELFVSTVEDFDLKMALSLEKQSLLAVALHNYNFRYGAVACLDLQVENSVNKKEPFYYKNLVFDAFYKHSNGKTYVINMRAVDLSANSLINYRLKRQKNKVDVYIFSSSDLNAIKKDLMDKEGKLNKKALFLYQNHNNLIFMNFGKVKDNDFASLNSINAVEIIKHVAQYNASSLVQADDSMFAQLNHLYDKAQKDLEKYQKTQGERGHARLQE